MVDRSQYQIKYCYVPPLEFVSNLDVAEDPELKGLTAEEKEVVLRNRFIQRVLIENKIMPSPPQNEVCEAYSKAWTMSEDEGMLSRTSFIASMGFLASGEFPSQLESQIIKVWNPTLTLASFKSVIEKFEVDIRDPTTFPGSLKNINLNLPMFTEAFPSTFQKPEPGDGLISTHLARQLSHASTITIGAGNDSVETLENETATISNTLSIELLDSEESQELPDIHLRLRWLPSHALTKEFREGFILYLYLPAVYSPEEPPQLAFHTSVSVRERVFLLGGMRRISDNIISDILQIRVKCSSYPFPLREDILNNPSYYASPEVHVYDTETDVYLKTNVTGDVPPPLCCASAVFLGSRYVFYYGGLQVETTLHEMPSEENGGCYYIERSFNVNNKAWILDTASLRFQEIRLMPDEDAPLKVPIKLERFGHTMVAAELKPKSTAEPWFFDAKKPHSAPERSVLSIYVFGGYSYNVKSKKFSCLNYNWKIDLGYTDPGDEELIFDTSGYYSCMESVNEGPTPRGFHAAILLDEPLGEHANYYSSNTSTGLMNEDSNACARRVMVIHGGTNLSNIFGDVWKYAFHSKKWERLKLKTFLFNDECKPSGGAVDAEFHKAGHLLVMLDRYLLFEGGFNETFVRTELIEARKKYNSKNVYGYKEKWSKDAYDVSEDLSTKLGGEFRRTVMLDMNTNMFVYSKNRLRTLTYVNYKDVLEGTQIPHNVRRLLWSAVNSQDSVAFRNIILKHEHLFTTQSLQRLVFVMRVRSTYTIHMNTVGSTTCFLNKKLVTIGGILLLPLSQRELLEQAAPDAPAGSFVNVMKRGAPLVTVFMRQMPIFTSHLMNSYGVNREKERERKKSGR